MSKEKNFISYKIGQKIKKIRKAQNISLKFLGDMIGISSRQISNYENGKDRIKIDILFDISLALNVSLNLLIDEKSL